MQPKHLSKILTLSKPAMFLFSAKNSAGDFCCSTSALRFAMNALLREVGQAVVITACFKNY